LFVVNGILHIFFVQRQKDRTCQRRLDFVAIFIGFKNIRSQTQKLS